MFGDSFIYVLIVVMVAAIASGVRTAAAFGAATLLFMLTGYITPAELVSHLGAPIVTILALVVIISQTLVRSPVFISLAHKVAASQHALRWNTLGASILSGFFNNTGVVATLISSVTTFRPQAARMWLLPISYAAMMGGTLTVIGGATNLFVAGTFAAQGLGTISMFDFTPIAAALLLCGLPYLWFVAPRLLSDAASEEELELLVAEIEADSPLIGKELQWSPLRHLGTGWVSAVTRSGAVIAPVPAEFKFAVRDKVHFAGTITPEQLNARTPGLNVLQFEPIPEGLQLVRVSIMEGSSLIGNLVRETNFYSEYGGSIVSIERGGNALVRNPGTVKLRRGDVLVVNPTMRFFSSIRGGTGLAYAGLPDAAVTMREQKPLVADRNLWWNFCEKHGTSITAFSFLAAVLLSATGLYEFLGGLLLVLGIGISVRAVTLSDIVNRLPLELLSVVVASLAMAQIVGNTALPQMVGGLLASIEVNTFVVLLVLYLVTVMLTELMTNIAAVSLVLPVALGATSSLGIDPLAVAFTAAFASNASYLTPYGHQTNLMVYGIGKYRFSDYIKLGSGLAVINMFVVILLVSLFV